MLRELRREDSNLGLRETRTFAGLELKEPLDVEDSDLSRDEDREEEYEGPRDGDLDGVWMTRGWVVVGTRAGALVGRGAGGDVKAGLSFTF